MRCSKEKMAAALSKVFEAEHGSGSGGNYVGIARRNQQGELNILIDGTFDMLDISQKVLDALKG